MAFNPSEFVISLKYSTRLQIACCADIASRSRLEVGNQHGTSISLVLLFYTTYSCQLAISRALMSSQISLKKKNSVKNNLMLIINYKK